MKKPNSSSKWSSSDKPRTAPAGVPAPDTVDKTGAKITSLPAKSAEPSPSHAAPVNDDKRESNR